MHNGDGDVRKCSPVGETSLVGRSVKAGAGSGLKAGGLGMGLQETHTLRAALNGKDVGVEG